TEQGVGGARQDPGADPVADDPLPRPRDVGQQRRIPPEGVGVHDDAHRVGGAPGHHDPGLAPAGGHPAAPRRQRGGPPAAQPGRRAVGGPTGRTLATATALGRRAGPRSGLPGPSPPETGASVPVPSRAASAIAALLSAIAIARVAGSAWVKNPPRHRLDTRSP